MTGTATDILCISATRMVIVFASHFILIDQFMMSAECA